MNFKESAFFYGETNWKATNMIESAWQEWVGTSENRSDRVTATPIAQLAATLDLENIRPVDGQAVRPLWHWLFFTPTTKQADIGADGHPNKGHFLPPIPLPRRMWAGSRVVFHEALKVGEEIHRDSRIAKIDAKQGRNGPLAFVTVQHDIQQAGRLIISEEHDIVYRELARPNDQTSGLTSAPTDDTFSRVIKPDPVLLFRYSALTFNGHRIHYDRQYATEVESYPGLVVHGPLIATLLMDLLHREIPEVRIRKFQFRGISPLFDINDFTVCGRIVDENHISLWAKNHKGQLAMHASAELHQSKLTTTSAQ